MKRILVLALVLVTAFSLFAGGSSETAAAPSGKLKIALIIENTIDDKGWCQAMYDGLVSAEKNMPGEFEFSVAEKQAPVDAGSMARQFVADGYNLIIAHGAQYKNLILEMADQYPNVSFAYGTSADIGPANVYTYMPESEETGYLSGIIAGMLTKANIVGLVGPVDGGDAARYNRGFVMGVQKVNRRSSLPTLGPSPITSKLAKSRQASLGTAQTFSQAPPSKPLAHLGRQLKARRPFGLARTLPRSTRLKARRSASRHLPTTMAQSSSPS